MAKYRMVVVETVAQESVYVVEADSKEEARLKALEGVTVEEWPQKVSGEVLDRTCGNVEDMS